MHIGKSQALVPLAPSVTAAHDHLATTALPAPFLAHLIATAEALPQTRQRRRGEPCEAIARYREMAERLRA